MVSSKEFREVTGMSTYRFCHEAAKNYIMYKHIEEFNEVFEKLLSYFKENSEKEVNVDE